MGYDKQKKAQKKAPGRQEAVPLVLPKQGGTAAESSGKRYKARKRLRAHGAKRQDTVVEAAEAAAGGRASTKGRIRPPFPYLCPRE